jgi:thiol:disulfide interchange protein DsbD
MLFLKKSIPFLFLLLFAQHLLFAQDSVIVRWKTDIKKLADREYQIQFEGTIQKDWHLYAADSSEGLMGLKANYPAGAADILQSSISTPFVSQKDPVFENRIKQVASDKVLLIQRITIADQRLSSLQVKLTYEVASQENFIPEEQSIALELKAGGQSSTALNIPVIETNQFTANCGGETISDSAKSSDGHTALFFLGFLGGLIALLTPCVFPMIPLTVSFFTKKSPTKSAGIRNALLYGFFIFIIYVLLSLPFHFIDSVNPALLNNISTNVYLNSAFFVIFIFFAFSFFGFYEITLPASLSSGADSKAGVGNVLGIFFMALTLALVSFSCTGPILGSLLAGSLSADGGAMQLTAGMAGFGLALALPFALFALFPHWLQSLPKSGGWLTTVKIVLGFFELALAFKFLSNADLVQHWGLLKREVFIGIWVIVGLLLTLYLFGKIKLPHDTIPAKISKGRL